MLEHQEAVFIHLGLAKGIATWIAVFLTLSIYSFLYKDNPLFKFVEHVFAGVASAYVFCSQWHTVVKPNLIDPALSSYFCPLPGLSTSVPSILTEQPVWISLSKSNPSVSWSRTT